MEEKHKNWRKHSCDGSPDASHPKKCKKHLLLKHQSLVFTKEIEEPDGQENDGKNADEFFKGSETIAVKFEHERSREMSSSTLPGEVAPKTADLMDLEPNGVQVAEDIFKNYGGTKRFFGQIETVRCFENNPVVRETLSMPGMGRVLVVDGAASRRYALMGDQLGTLACENNWKGVIINGCVRDSEELSDMPVGVKAIGTHPQKSKKENPGEKGVPVCFAGVKFTPGSWVYADSDGVIVTKQQIHNGLASKY